ncbi:aspartate aminotransferase [Pseudomassariella vexata]|uniref:Aspartate aminotransferase n=1 Tax=Pseudomassariella vexata TaxID=1141098 RepID=A0A1Y2DGU1_9PEZI|nr:aspartate aminotransferase [Pseudomassariella vexata]ORY58447.1 aspartate aminotransferase [Pseudomassariella vexata]
MASLDASSSAFSEATFIPPDSIFDVTRRYLADTTPNKVNLGQGTYRDADGKPWILPSVRSAKGEIAAADCGHEYLPIAGLKSFRDEAVKLAFHGTKALEENRIASCQAISGTGALLLTGLALKRASPKVKTIYITEPTWSNHQLLFESLGFAVQTIPYYKAGHFDFESYISVLSDIKADGSSAVVLHACAHNPTGCDPSREQWKAIAAVVKEKHIFPIFDAAYLGFNSGNVDEDAWAIRYFVEDLHLEAAVCLSFAKSMGLYGERIGLTSFVAGSSDLARTMQSVLENVQRATVSNPPAYGARIVAQVLGTPDIKTQWDEDLGVMSGRIRTMRERLYEELVKAKTPGSWEHIVKQSGMFAYTGLEPAQVVHLEDKWHVYMAETGRISIAGLNESNVVYFAEAVDSTVRTVK